jgi:hypothetical protein
MFLLQVNRQIRDKEGKIYISYKAPQYKLLCSSINIELFGKRNTKKKVVLPAKKSELLHTGYFTKSAIALNSEE